MLFLCINYILNFINLIRTRNNLKLLYEIIKFNKNNEK